MGILIGCGFPESPSHQAKSPTDRQAEQSSAKALQEYQEFFKQHFRGILKSDINIDRNNKDLIPFAPLVGQYEAKGKGGITPSKPILAIKFPPIFRVNIPLEIKKMLSKYDISSLELFFIVQSEPEFLDKTNNVQLVTHAWAYPNYPDNFKGTIFNKNLLMGIFGADKDIIKQIPNNELAPFNVHIHDNAFSPPNSAGLNIKTNMLDLSFWSVVVDVESKRAAVTLHWLIKPEHYMDDEDTINIKGPNLYDMMAGANFGDLLKRLQNNSNSFFKDTPLLEKLLFLTRPIF